MVDQDNYQMGKLKKFLKLINLKMQDTLNFMILKNYKELLEFVLKYVPTRIEVNGEDDVQTYYGDYKVDSLNYNELEVKVLPLFQI